MGALKTRKKNSTNGELARQDEIYRIAAEIIYEKGFDAASMNDIADAVGMTKAGLYHYIPGKKDLLFAVMNYAMDLLDDNVIAPAHAIADAELRLHAIIENHAQLIAGGIAKQGNSHLTILTDELGGLTPPHRRKIIERKRAYLDLVRDTLRALQQEKKFKKIDATVAAFSLFGMLMWLARWYRPDGKKTSREIAANMKEIVLHGLAVH